MTGPGPARRAVTEGLARTCPAAAGHVGSRIVLGYRDGAPIARAELVGLLPREVLLDVPAARWEALDLAEDRTIEARLKR